MPNAPLALLLAPTDNIAVAARELSPGAQVTLGGLTLEVKARIDVGHKFAVKPIAEGERVVKYRAPIGVATRDIAPGEAVHTHNLASGYIPTYTLEPGHRYIEEVK